MRTTIRLDDALLRRAKAQAAASGCSLNDFIADAVRAALALRATTARGVELPTFRGGTLLPGVDLDDTAGLLELMDGSEPLRGAPGAAPPRPAKVAERPRKRRP
ncbi:MAG TPA: YlcI/YnfO family protein [Gemmatimonadaceae bacterium]|nr:YlcI/YnfO family protein [Gemmatimonadaceae bacterium]